jgi:GMP synthase-like glutamine amidotransferase
MKKINDLKIYVPYGSRGYANWISYNFVNSVEEADLVLITGGEDINPRLYGDRPHSTTWYNVNRDEIELTAVREAIKQEKFLWGTCRGIQLLCAIAGGRLVQDMNHSYSHKIITNEGVEMWTNSLHHQMQYPFELVEGEDYNILAYARSLSTWKGNPYYGGPDDKQIFLPSDKDGFIIEPEVVHYPKIKALGHQAHPEMMYKHSAYGPMVEYTQELLTKFINNNLKIETLVCS